MKKIFEMLMIGCIAATAFTSCSDDPKDDVKPVLAIEWTANPEFNAVELAGEMDVNIVLKAEAGLGGLTISVDSPTEAFNAALNEMIGIEENKGSEDKKPLLDLVNDTQLADALAALSVPAGSELVGKTEVELNLSTIVPMILLLNPEADTNHKFIPTVRDSNGNEVTKELTFHYTGVTEE